MNEPAPIPATPDALRPHLAALRDAVLHLHKALIDSERVSYEQTMGTIPSPGYFLQLLTNDPWFAWLHPLSKLIVAIDETLDAEAPLTRSGLDVLVNQTSGLLNPTENGEGFAGHYYDALQRDPDVLYAHATTARLVRPLRAVK